MNRTKLKNYAPQARRDFIQAMTDRAAFYGLFAKKTEQVTEKGDVAVIGGREFPRSIVKKRKALVDRIKKDGFEQVMEAMAYTWFNRLVAIRFMELHGYLDHGYRVLSHPEGKPTPEILEQAEHAELPGLKKEAVIDLKLAGNKESELYRLLLTAQCNALHTAMPFLFEKIDDETELLLPENLLNSDSLMRKLVGEIEEEDWNEVEIIGWLYQFYISEKKEEVIGKVVASEDIPAATQLFTPNWIVKYLVQNTLGRQWLATYPQSALRQQMEYYIEPAEQTPEVQEQLKAVTPTSLNPEELTLLDPACGSGHILVEAYDLFKAIYQERGYRAKDIPALILQKNLFGLEIDDRAAQLASFALMMKARADDRRIFESEAKPSILAFEDSQGMNGTEIAYALNAPIRKDRVPNEFLFEEIQEEKDGLFSKKALAEKDHVSQGDIAALLELFENTKTFGSLIQVPPKLAAKLTEIEKRLDDVLTHGDLTHASAQVIKPLVQQARLLARQFGAVVANPPYMGVKYLNPVFKSFVKDKYRNAHHDLFAASLIRCNAFAKANAPIGVLIPANWMTLGSFEHLRSEVISHNTINTCVELEVNAFEPAMICVSGVTFSKSSAPNHCGTYIRLSDFRGSQNQGPKTLEAIANPSCGWLHRVRQSDFQLVPGSPIGYWVKNNVRRLFQLPNIGSISDPQVGLQTSDNARFVRYWHEVAFSRIVVDCSDDAQAARSSAKWFPMHKGGEFRKWYGNRELVVNWESSGSEIKKFVAERYSYLNGNVDYVVKDRGFFFREGVTWSHTTVSHFSCRYVPVGSISNVEGPTIFYEGSLQAICALLNSSAASHLLELINPSFHYLVGVMRTLPVPNDVFALPKLDECERTASSAVSLAKADWDSFETSWDFRTLPVVAIQCDTLGESQAAADTKYLAAFKQMKELEEENNRFFIEAYGLQDELSSEVTDEKITLYRPDRQKDIKRLLSYAIGCVMGRYSLDKPGLVYAHSGNQGFDASQYMSFRADDDGIIPLLETDWGISQDATNQFVEFIGVAWSKEHLEVNLKFVADSLGPNSSEQPRETIRRYLATGFYKHHLSMYKKRPIYWLFSSGKQRAFQCLVYLHRYHEGTLARMRTEYVIPLQGQIAARIEQIEGDKAKATSTSYRKKLQKEQDDLKKQQTELATFEEKLKHAADQKIALDLDDGVKVNYAKFGDLLAEAKTVTGGSEE